MLLRSLISFDGIRSFAEKSVYQVSSHTIFRPFSLGHAVSSHQLPETEGHGQGLDTLRQLQYGSIIQSIKAFLSQMDEVRSTRKPGEPKMTQLPSTADFQTTLDVLEYLSTSSKSTGLTSDSSFDDVVMAVRTQLSVNPALPASLSAFQGNKSKRCLHLPLPDS